MLSIVFCVFFSRCRSLYLPEDPVRRAQALNQSGKQEVEKLPLNFLLLNLSPDRHFAAMLKFFMDWMATCSADMSRSSSPPRGCTPSPLLFATNEWFNNDGLVMAGRFEPYAMQLCNAILRGYGFRSLALPGARGIDLRSCGGQFEYKLENCVLGLIEHRHVAAISPLLPHEHAGQPCHSRPIFFAGKGKCGAILRNEMTQRNRRDASPYVSCTFLFFLH